MSGIDLIFDTNAVLYLLNGIKLPDAIIAATVIKNRVPLLTADKGFRQIAELDLILLEPVI
ncbi:MAG: hypothetical protein IJR44_07350 [Neisseriaceae bacterium]|nr:hypothetical protein [Neisseriaceae bacterium]